MTKWQFRRLNRKLERAYDYIQRIKGNDIYLENLGENIMTVILEIIAEYSPFPKKYLIKNMKMEK